MEEMKEAIAEQQSLIGGGKRLKKEKNSKLWLVPVVLFLVTALAYAGLGWYATSYLDSFWPGTYILAQDVSDQTPAQAAETLSAALPELRLMVYDLPEEGKSFSLYEPNAGHMTHIPADAPPHTLLSFEELGITVDPAAVVNEAFAYQRDDSLLTAGRDFLNHYSGRLFSNYHGRDTFVVNEAQMAQAAHAAAEALSFPAVDAAYELKESSIALTAPKDGQAVDEAALLEDIRSLDWLTDLSVKASVGAVPARTLSAKDIYNEVAGEMKNAGYDKETDSITPETVGVQFHVASAQEALDKAEPGSTFDFPAEITYPEVTAAALKEVLFRDVLGEYTTKVSGTQGRRGNVKLSAAAIDGYIMNSGDVFSYNEAVGQRTAANGYAPAPAYVKGETVDEIGGGICQTTSTLYYACLLADLEITERYAHRYAPAYITLGMDATVSWGGPDYKFTNDTAYPLRIETTYENDRVTVRLIGTKTHDRYAKMTYEYLGKTEWTTVYQEDPAVAPGTQVVKTEPYTGHKVKSYHTIYNGDGSVYDSHYEATSDYKVRNKVVLVAPGELPAPSVPAVNPVTPAVPGETTPPSVIPAEPETEMQAPIIAVPEAPPEEALPEETVVIIPME